MSDKSFNILQWNANGIGNKQTELSIFLEAHNVKVAAIQESKLTGKSKSRNPWKITLEYTQLPLERSPKILRVILDPSISFHNHCNYVSDRIDKRNNMLKALAGSSWGQDKETNMDNSRGNQLADSVSISSFAVLNTDSPTRLPGNADPSSPDVSLAPASFITLS